MERKPLMVKLLLTGRYTADGHYYVQRCTYKDVHIKMGPSIHVTFNWPLWRVPYMECKPYSMIAKCHTRGPDYILAHCACEVVRPLPSPTMVLP